jgi:hypothetical protein
MRNYVLYKIFIGTCLLGSFAAVSTIVSAENRSSWTTGEYAPPPVEQSYNSGANNPWHISEKQKEASRFWSLPEQQNQQYQQYQQYQENNMPNPVYQEPYYQVHENTGYQVRENTDYQVHENTDPYKQTPEKPIWGQQPIENGAQERYVTPDIIESLNRQEAQHYSRLNGGKGQNFAPDYQVPSYGRYPQEHSAPPAYGMGSLNPAFDVPAVSPWGDTPDVLYRGEEFPWMPNEAIGGVPPIHVPPFSGNSGLGGVDDSAGRTENKVFNPFTFLQKEN